ncbi:sensor histidine kinase [Aminobacter sp. Piv2-1]|uniref:sensor histidine kinase n=1 Tax=Aminobacter sp. Piv2-1 TaxID=3031122 RepID=UPI0030EC4584
MGGGLTLDLEADVHLLERTLDQVVDELRAAHPDRSIVAEFSLDEAVPVDHGRVAQLLSNLIGNALSYGDTDKPVRVSAKANKAGFDLAVENGGAPVPTETLATLFEPFARGEGDRNGEGLGLGLFIASEIARAHGGTLTATSGAGVTRFVFDMPAP